MCVESLMKTIKEILRSWKNNESRVLEELESKLSCGGTLNRYDVFEESTAISLVKVIQSVTRKTDDAVWFLKNAQIIAVCLKLIAENNEKLQAYDKLFDNRFVFTIYQLLKTLCQFHEKEAGEVFLMFIDLISVDLIVFPRGIEAAVLILFSSPLELLVLALEPRNFESLNIDIVCSIFEAIDKFFPFWENANLAENTKQSSLATLLGKSKNTMMTLLNSLHLVGEFSFQSVIVMTAAYFLEKKDCISAIETLADKAAPHLNKTTRDLLIRAFLKIDKVPTYVEKYLPVADFLLMFNNLLEGKKLVHSFAAIKASIDNESFFAPAYSYPSKNRVFWANINTCSRRLSILTGKPKSSNYLYIPASSVNAVVCTPKTNTVDIQLSKFPLCEQHLYGSGQLRKGKCIFSLKMESIEVLTSFKNNLKLIFPAEKFSEVGIVGKSQMQLSLENLNTSNVCIGFLSDPSSTDSHGSITAKPVKGPITYGRAQLTVSSQESRFTPSVAPIGNASSILATDGSRGRSSSSFGTSASARKSYSASSRSPTTGSKQVEEPNKSISVNGGAKRAPSRKRSKSTTPFVAKKRPTSNPIRLNLSALMEQSESEAASVIAIDRPRVLPKRMAKTRADARRKQQDLDNTSSISGSVIQQKEQVKNNENNSSYLRRNLCSEDGGVQEKQSMATKKPKTATKSKPKPNESVNRIAPKQKRTSLAGGAGDASLLVTQENDGELPALAEEVGEIDASGNLVRKRFANSENYESPASFANKRLSHLQTASIEKPRRKANDDELNEWCKSVSPVISSMIATGKRSFVSRHSIGSQGAVVLSARAAGAKTDALLSSSLRNDPELSPIGITASGSPKTGEATKSNPLAKPILPDAIQSGKTNQVLTGDEYKLISAVETLVGGTFDFVKKISSDGAEITGQIAQVNNSVRNVCDSLRVVGDDLRGVERCTQYFAKDLVQLKNLEKSLFLVKEAFKVSFAARFGKADSRSHFESTFTRLLRERNCMVDPDTLAHLIDAVVSFQSG